MRMACAVSSFGRLLVGALLAFVVVGTGCATGKDARGSGSVREPPNEPWRATRPSAGPPAVTPLPNFQKAELKNGLTLIVVEDHALPTIDASLVVRAGAALDGREGGLALLTWDLVDEGAGTFNAAGLDVAFADIGTQVASNGGREQGSIDARFLKQHADKALELLSLVVQKPTFSQGDFDRLKKLHVDSLKAKEGDPETIAWQALTARIYGADHAYGQPADGTTATVEKLRLASAKRFWNDHVGPKAAALVLVGDITLDEARPLVEKHLGKWRGGGKGTKAPPAPRARTGLQIVVVDFPGAPQTLVRVGRALLAAGDADEPAAVVMNQVLGGMFSSRLNLKLREEKQWAYGAFSEFEPRLGPGPFFVGADVQTPATVDAVVEILAQLDAMKTSGVTDAELALGRAAYAKSLPALFSLAPQQVAVAGQLFTLGLPVDHHAKLIDAVNAITAEQVKAAAEKAIVRDDLVVVLVGDRASFGAALAEKNLGTVTFLNKDGSPAK
jgi:predicted Zn-dependent peptidase